MSTTNPHMQLATREQIKAVVKFEKRHGALRECVRTESEVQCRYMDGHFHVLGWDGKVNAAAAEAVGFRNRAEEAYERIGQPRRDSLDTMDWTREYHRLSRVARQWERRAEAHRNGSN